MASAEQTNGTGLSHAAQVALGGKPANWVPIKEEPLFSRRKLKIICVGAGYSGLTLAHKIKHELKLTDVIDLVIYEKNPEVGGTWYENRYPGVACDIPAHAYSFVFEPNPDWSQFYCPGPEIESYIKRTVRKYKLDEPIQFNSKVTEAIWDEEAGKWKITVDQNGASKKDEADILVNAGGFLNKWKWPKIDGLFDFKGKLLHTANWDDTYDFTGKRVAVIGNGSSGIQTVAALAPKVQKLVNFVRNPTWISVNIAGDKAIDGHNFKYTEEQKKQFREDPKALFEHGKELEASVNNFFFGMYRDHPAAQGLTAIVKSQMAERMKNQPELASKMIPTWLPGCRRLTPGDGYLEVFEEANATMCWDAIEKFTETGIKTTAGEEEFDLIVCASGFDTSWVPAWKLAGRNGVTLDDRWKGGDPEAFFSVQVDGLPNYFMFNGPNAVISHGSVLRQVSWTCDYILNWAKKIATEDIKSIDVKREAVDDFNVWSQEFLKRMTWADECRSWYKNGKEKGQLTGVYAGSMAHFKNSLENMGAEHFDVRWNSSNRFRYLGNGEGLTDLHGLGDLVYYLNI
ncbi:putative flavoprotein [Lophium mytilinum]|uniref:Putative flavoprotein n=1 Tax=Lophium mytilinum TaxID=390894 RepID=A0A6A6R1V0_9PEZI|nr:putative flavoprotein [Lophium mytilinum]